MYDKEIKVLETINNNRDLSQRGIAKAAGISIGKSNYLVRHFQELGYIKLEDTGTRKPRYVVTEEGLLLLEKYIKSNVASKILISSNPGKQVKAAIILAAGESQDFQEPVGSLKLGDKTVIERLIRLLRESGIEKIIIVAGYKSSFYESLGKKENIIVLTNNVYKESGTMVSLALAKDYLDDDFLLVEGDLVLEKKAITEVLNHQNRDCILITNESGSGDEVFVELRNEFLFKMSKDRHQFNRIDGEMIGVCKISIDIFKKMLEEFQNNSNPFLNYEYMLFDMARTFNISYVKIEDLIWSEIDTKWHYRNLTNFIYPMIVKSESMRGDTNEQY